MAFFKGFTAFFRGMAFTFSRGLWPWYLLTLLLWVVLVTAVSVSLASFFTGLLENWLNSFLPSENHPDGMWNLVKFWLSQGLAYTLAVITHLLIWYIVGRYIKYIIQLLLAPLLAYISAVTEEKLTGKSYAFHWIEFLKDILRGIALTIRNIVLETLMVVCSFFICWTFPLAGLIVPLVLYLVNCFFMGFNFIDYAAERKRMSIGKSTGWMLKNYGAVTGFGLAYNLISMFPLLDWLLAPISAASGGAILFEELNTGS